MSQLNDSSPQRSSSGSSPVDPVMLRPIPVKWLVLGSLVVVVVVALSIWAYTGINSGSNDKTGKLPEEANLPVYELPSGDLRYKEFAPGMSFALFRQKCHQLGLSPFLMEDEAPLCKTPAGSPVLAKYGVNGELTFGNYAFEPPQFEFVEEGSVYRLAKIEAVYRAGKQQDTVYDSLESGLSSKYGQPPESGLWKRPEATLELSKRDRDLTYYEKARRGLSVSETWTEMHVCLTLVSNALSPRVLAVRDRQAELVSAESLRHQATAEQSRQMRDDAVHAEQVRRTSGDL